ncbi:hypothetical protein CFOL_v3_19886 [Cephalotus follicularis]|uniref:Uncharacterized protein n=1 Tax=Cephalotus follicularis TaxID=3775 RepID=A0A1Q3C8H9_CEPFO|nr:hypothetical protein CFOL_v3_19886 [Cephalotus follicularis]
MENASRIRAFSNPELVPSTTPKASHGADQWTEDYSFEGMATNVKLLLKLIQDHQDANLKYNDDRRTQRVAGMMTILDDVKSRIQKSQSSGKKRMAELRRCYTDLRANPVPREKKPNEPITDEKEILRKELNGSLAARKSLEMMCSSLGKEKEIMASELARKVHEVNEMEELINDLRVQNETLLAKVKACATEHKDKKCGGGEAQGKAALQDRNKALSEQLLKSLDGYRSLKRKYKEAKDENMMIHATLEEMGVDVTAGLDQVRGFRQRMATATTMTEKKSAGMEQEITTLEHIFQCFDTRISKHCQKSEYAKPKAWTNATKPSVA